MIIYIHIYQADKDGNGKIDFSEFNKLWLAIRGEGEVRSYCYRNLLGLIFFFILTDCVFRILADVVFCIGADFVFRIGADFVFRV